MTPCSDAAVVFTLLPGPDRKRGTRPYGYRLTYRNPDAEAVGCVMLWEVCGGRLHYQVALERDQSGGLRFHCSCADAVFRGEPEGRFCKHVRGLLDIGRCGGTGPAPVSLGA
jgi:hypothetical protein